MLVCKRHWRCQHHYHHHPHRPFNRLHELQALCKEHRPKAQGTWTEQEWVGIESRVLRNVQEPICLHPSVLVFCLSNVAHYNKSKYAALNKERFTTQLNQERAVYDVKEEEAFEGAVRPVTMLSPHPPCLCRADRMATSPSLTRQEKAKHPNSVRSRRHPAADLLTRAHR